MKQIQKIFPFLTFDNNKFGYKNIDTITERNENKDLVNYGNITLYTSGNMYPKTDKDFIYAILEQKTMVRPYRRKTWHESVYNKQFFSAKTMIKLITELKAANTNFKFNILNN